MWPVRWHLPLNLRLHGCETNVWKDQKDVSSAVSGLGKHASHVDVGVGSVMAVFPVHNALATLILANILPALLTSSRNRHPGFKMMTAKLLISTNFMLAHMKPRKHRDLFNYRSNRTMMVTKRDLKIMRLGQPYFDRLWTR